MSPCRVADRNKNDRIDRDEVNACLACWDGKGCCFLVFVQLFEKYGTLIEGYTALIEKVSALIGFRDDAKALEGLFDEYDTNHSGELDHPEVKKLLTNANEGAAPSDEEVAMVIKMADREGSGTLCASRAVRVVVLEGLLLQTVWFPNLAPDHAWRCFTAAKHELMASVAVWYSFLLCHSGSVPSEPDSPTGTFVPVKTRESMCGCC
eukprot:SAG31_NODE_1292_length_8967_cov_2.998985_3_plen_207_part_00